MQSVSPKGRFVLLAVPGIAWQRARASVPAGALWSSLLTFLLVLTIGRSTQAASWVPGLDMSVIPLVALAGAVALGLLAVTPIPWGLCVVAGMAAGPVVAGYISLPAFRTTGLLEGSVTNLQIIQTWWAKVLDGSAFTQQAFVLFLITWLMWVTGAWLAWCVLRWGQPLIGLVPGAAAFGTNVVNYPDQQNGYVLSFLVLTFALLLWTNYKGSIAKATRAKVKLTGDARWDFWETGLVAMAALIVLAILLPPLSTVDKTATMESSLFSKWAELQLELNHPSLPGNGIGIGGGSTGFSASVGLGGALKTNKTLIFTYTVAGTYVGPKYFRGVNVTLAQQGQWLYPANDAGDAVDLRVPIPKNVVPDYGDATLNQTFATFTVTMVRPPDGFSDVLFYPGQLTRVDRQTTAYEVSAPPDFQPPQLATIDKLSVAPSRSNGIYNVTVQYPDVSEAQLRSADTTYADWLSAYSILPDRGYRSLAAMQRVHDLALKIVHDANATNPYDMATAIQDYLRGPTFKYTLTPPLADFGTDPLEYFLFTSHQGYCQYFATAMGDMMRSLGIPTRLVNGYGAGTFNTATNRFEVRSSDSHTWVESYFPGYGWIPFEPTHDTDNNLYFPIPRHTTTTNVCIRENQCPSPGPAGTPSGGRLPNDPNGPTGSNSSPGAGAGFKLHFPDANTLTKIAGVLLAILLVLAAVTARYLRPRTVMGVWKRTLILARLAGAQIAGAETPFELGRRLARAFPEAASPVGDLANGFVVAAYAPPDLAQSSRVSVMEAWTTLRPLMLRRVVARFRPGRS
jgi:transglutaminase-like putative cysteine protease